MFPPIKDTIPNQDKNILGLQKYQYLPPHVPPFSSGFKSLRIKANDDNLDTTDNARTAKVDTSRTNRNDFIEKVKATKKRLMTKTKRKICNINTLIKVYQEKQRRRSIE